MGHGGITRSNQQGIPIVAVLGVLGLTLMLGTKAFWTDLKAIEG
ncbi:MAG: hypothetical protein RLZZ435_1238 [Cyanobacteriota bacterium]